MKNCSNFNIIFSSLKIPKSKLFIRNKKVKRLSSYYAIRGKLKIHNFNLKLTFRLAKFNRKNTL